MMSVTPLRRRLDTIYLDLIFYPALSGSSVFASHAQTDSYLITRAKWLAAQYKGVMLRTTYIEGDLWTCIP
jgi:hypothetical protein